MVTWRLLDGHDCELAVMPASWTPGDGHAIAWGLYAREASELTEAVLVDHTGRRRLLHADLTTLPFSRPDELGLHRPG